MRNWIFPLSTLLLLGCASTPDHEVEVTVEYDFGRYLQEASGRTKAARYEVYAALHENLKEETIDVVTALEGALAEAGNGETLDDFFHTRSSRFANQTNLSDELRLDWEASLESGTRILQARMERFGGEIAQARRLNDRQLVYQVKYDGDLALLRKLFHTSATIGFWETWDNHELFDDLNQLNEAISASLQPAPDTTSYATDDPMEVLLDSVPMLTEEELAEISAPLWSKLVFPVDYEGRAETGCCVGYCAVKDTGAVNQMLNDPAFANDLPADAALFWGCEPEDNGYMRLYAMKRTVSTGGARIDGSVIVNAEAEMDQQTNGWTVMMSMNSPGTAEWEDMTRENMGKAVGITLGRYDDACVSSAPIVNGVISGGQTQISMGGRNASAQDDAEIIASILRSGSMPAPLKIIDEKVIK